MRKAGPFLTLPKMVGRYIQKLLMGNMKAYPIESR